MVREMILVYELSVQSFNIFAYFFFWIYLKGLVKVQV